MGGYAARRIEPGRRRTWGLNGNQMPRAAHGEAARSPRSGRGSALRADVVYVCAFCSAAFAIGRPAASNCRIDATIQAVQRVEALWTKILGVLLILLGLTLFGSPQVAYTRRETVIHTQTTDITAKRQKTTTVPRLVSVLIIGAGVLAFVYASKSRQQ